MNNCSKLYEGASPICGFQSPSRSQQKIELPITGSRKAPTAALSRVIPATGRAVTFTGNNIMHLSQGRIRALWGQLDGYGRTTQLGVIPQRVPDYPKSIGRYFRVRPRCDVRQRSRSPLRRQVQRG